jgi:hypothetical protein
LVAEHVSRQFRGGPEFDVLYDPTARASLFLVFASQPIGDSTPDDWVAVARRR